MPVVNQVWPDVGVNPLESKVAEALALQTALVNSKLRLFKAGTIAVIDGVTKALLEANECDFDGYTAGGLTIAAWGDPYVDNVEGDVLLSAPSKQFNYVDAAAVSNEVGGWFLVDAAGNLRGVAEFDEPITMDDDLDAIVLVITRRI